MPETNVLTISFGKQRAPEIRRDQIRLLTERVLDEVYGGVYATMLVDFHEAQLQGYDGTLLHWLQEKLGTTTIIEPAQIQ